jgi:hypothetical protein
MDFLGSRVQVTVTFAVSTLTVDRVGYGRHVRKCLRMVNLFHHEQTHHPTAHPSSDDRGFNVE